jgi:hypothetical protein
MNNYQNTRPNDDTNSTDSVLVNEIANALWSDGPETTWSADTLDVIAEAITRLRPDLVPVE